MAMALQQFGQTGFAIGDQFEKRTLPAGDPEPILCTQLNQCARFGRFAGPDLGQATAVIQQALEQDLDLATTFFVPEQSGWQHTGIVENQQVSGLKPLKKVPEAGVDQTRSVLLDHQKPAGTALRQRVAGNQGFRQ